MGKSNGVYQRKDNRWEARYKKGVDENGKTLYGAVYAKTREEAILKRDMLVGDLTLGKRDMPMEMNLLILGAGKLGREVKNIAQSLHMFQKISFLDDRLTGDDILGTCKEALKFREEYPCAFVAVRENHRRKKLAKFLKERNFLIPNIVSPAATISQDTVLGKGVAILPQCTVNSAVIGDYCILESNSLVDNGAVLKKYVHLDCGGIILKNITVRECTGIKSGEIYGVVPGMGIEE